MTCHSEIQLAHWETSLAQFIGVLRQGLSSADGRKDPKRSPRNAYRIHADGAGGEIAFARWRNLYPLLNFLPTKGGADLVADDGKTIDVKTTTKPEGNLLVPGHLKDDPCDIYALMLGDADSGAYHCLGWAKASEVFTDQNRRDFGYGLTFLVTQDKLRKPS